MATSYRTTPPVAARESGRLAVRLLFAGVLLGACGFVLLRAAFGEPYPGPFMPAFKGTGLTMVSPSAAATIIPRITVTFADRTTTEIPQDVLFADVPSPAVHRVIIFSLIPNPDVPPPTGHRTGYGKWVTALFPGHYLAPPPPATKIPDDARAYLRRRLAKLFPGKKPASLTVTLYRDTFPVADFHQGTFQPVSQTTVTFDEGV